MNTSTDTENVKQPPRFIRAMGSLNDRRMAAMFLLSLAAGIPYGAVIGALNAWLTEAGIVPSQIGVLSFIILAYSFKFIWAPCFQRSSYPLKQSFGPRRAWLLTFQIIIAALLGLMAFTNPAAALPVVAGAALLIALSSATHDIVLDAWRIEVAETDEDLDLMSALYQFGYRIAGLLTGALALVLSSRIGWPATFGVLAAFMLLATLGTMIAPEPKPIERPKNSELADASGIAAQGRDKVVSAVLIAWAVAIFFILSFMADVLTYTPPTPEQLAGPNPPPSKPSGGVFIRTSGPLIVALTVLLPAVLAAYLNRFRKHAKTTQAASGTPIDSVLRKISDTMYASIILPLMDLTQRLGWAFILIFFLVLTYRFADLVWGAFAYPFYLDDRFGALFRTPDEIALASKTFGVVMTLLGSSLGAVALIFLGRMPCLVLGGLLAATTNLLFADLAAGRFIAETATFVPTEGGVRVQAFLAFTQLDHVLEVLPPLFGLQNSPGLTNLMGAIAGENLAVGFASVASVAFLTSIVNPKYAAVQYALLASLTMLIGSLGRAPLGDLIESDGYYTVFMITFWIGLVPVVLSVLEWGRQMRYGPPSTDTQPTPS